MNPAEVVSSLDAKEATAITTLGLIAGSGDFPLMVADAARRQGVRTIVAVGFKSQTDPKLEGRVDKMHTIGVGQLGKLIDIFKKAGATHAVMAGKLQHRLIFSDLRFDLRMLGMIARLNDRRADSILKAIAQEMEKDGITLMDSTRYLQRELASEGVLSRKKPSKGQWADIEFGRKIAWELARQDIGQAVAVKDKAVVAVEALEGTDEMILRAGKLAGPGVVIVKLNRPNQDMRFDVPVVGRQTLRTLASAGAAVIAIASDKTLILQREEFLSEAHRLGICVVGIVPDKSVEAG